VYVPGSVGVYVRLFVFVDSGVPGQLTVIAKYVSLLALQTTETGWFITGLLGTKEISSQLGCAGTGTYPLQSILHAPGVVSEFKFPLSQTSSMTHEFGSARCTKLFHICIPCFPFVLFPPGLLTLSTTQSPQCAI